MADTATAMALTKRVNASELMELPLNDDIVLKKVRKKCRGILESRGGAVNCSEFLCQPRPGLELIFPAAQAGKDRTGRVIVAGVPLVSFFFNGCFVDPQERICEQFEGNS